MIYVHCVGYGSGGPYAGRQAFDDLVNELLLKQQYAKRGIRVTDNEIITAAKTSPAKAPTAPAAPAHAPR